MSSRYYVKDLNKLRAFSQYLSRFASRITDTLSRIDQALRSETDWLEERKQFWAREVQRRQRALDDCRAESSASEGGQDCSAETRALTAAVEALEKARKWAVRIEQAVAEYQTHANRTKQLASSQLPKANADLGQVIANYDAYLSKSSPHISSDKEASAVTYKMDATGTITASTAGVQSEPVVEKGPSSITWSEKTAILKKIEDGVPITSDEMNALRLPISDLRAETLQQDYRWVQSLIDSEQFRAATAGLWLGQAPVANWGSVAWSLLGVTADTLKVIQYWKNR